MARSANAGPQRMLLQQVPVLSERAVRAAEERQDARVGRRASMPAARPLAIDRLMAIGTLDRLLRIAAWVDPDVVRIFHFRNRSEMNPKRRGAELRPADLVTALGGSDPRRFVAARQAEFA